jgi:hypothetical protein
MDALAVVVTLLAVLACLAAGLSVPDLNLAVTVAWSRVRYAAGPAEAAAGLAVTLAACAACAAGGAGVLLAAAARFVSDMSDRAAAGTIPAYAKEPCHA